MPNSIMSRLLPQGDLHVMVVKCHGERFAFIWQDGDEGAVCNVFGRFAANPDLCFTWYDAAKAAAKVRLHKDDGCGGK